MVPVDGQWDDGPDIDLNTQERFDLLNIVAQLYSSDTAAQAVLSQIDFPLEQAPNWQGLTPLLWWTQVFNQFNLGIINSPCRRLLSVAWHVYRANPVLCRLADRHLAQPAEPVEPEEPADAPDEGQAPPRSSPTCHVIVRADSEDERQAAAAQLGRVGLDPHEVWSTARAVSFRVGSGSSSAVRQLLERCDFGWTVVAAGEPDYLLHTLYVRGPDGRQFRVTDAPAAETVGNLTAEVMDQYPTTDPRNVVVDKVQTGGARRRLNPYGTLHEEEVGDGDSLEVGTEARAAAVNPLDRQDALSGVRNQVLAFAEARPGFVVGANSVDLPTEYEFSFAERSFAPPAQQGGEPVEIDKHVVLVKLGPDFPETPPVVFWETPIFHPNVFPTYDCEKLRQYPTQRGLLCLGALAESYQPGRDFGELCRLVVDVAGFRNYNLFEPTGDVDTLGQPVMRGDFYDFDAAVWVFQHQNEIEAIGGRRLFGSPVAGWSRYRNVVEGVDTDDVTLDHDVTVDGGPGAAGRLDAGA